MKFLSDLGVGDRFRPAHPRQMSLNGRLMARGHTYVVSKVYQMSPNIAICKSAQDSDSSSYWSLPPRCPVLATREKDPTEEQVYAFIGAKRWIVGYVLKWRPPAKPADFLYNAWLEAVLRVMYAVGKKEWSVEELEKTLQEKLPSFAGGIPKGVPMHWYTKCMMHRLSNRGLVVEIFDEACGDAIRAANLQETYFGSVEESQ
jgi:hypothetical protein